MVQLDVQPKKNKWLTWLIIIVILGLFIFYVTANATEI